MANDIIIDIEHISKSFDGVQVLKDINLKIREGEFVTLLGPSGSVTPVFHRLFLPETVQAEIVGDADAERKFIKCRHSVIFFDESEMVG